MSAVYDDPETLIQLGEFADILNTYFQLEGESRIGVNTAFMWWQRTGKGIKIALPLPIPAMRIGKQQSPAWKQADILFWFGDYKNLDVPLGREAGDAVRGKRIVKGARRRG